MTETEMIPEDVVQTARGVWREMGFVSDRLNQVPFIARALLAERNRCAAIAKNHRRSIPFAETLDGLAIAAAILDDTTTAFAGNC